jgi:hypothetical protein
MRIRDGKNLDAGSGLEKNRILDPGWENFGSGISISDMNRPHHYKARCLGSRTPGFGSTSRDTDPAPD